MVLSWGWDVPGTCSGPWMYGAVPGRGAFRGHASRTVPSRIRREEVPEMPTVFDLLDSEWRQLSSSRSAARRLHDVRALAGDAGTLADVERYVRGADAETADRVLLALVARAVDDDDLAARVLLQLLLPGTRNLARRWWALGDHDERAA